MIEVKNLTKRFGSKTAVNNISFEVKKGQVLGFLGPNGAGKSTTMRMITGYIQPDGGEILIDGTDMIADPIKAKAKIGYLPENAPLYPDMTVEAFLHFSAKIRGLSGIDREKAVGRALDMCFLQNVRGQSIDTLSKGYRHRTCFAQSVIADPDILILDEPTDGLDPNQKHEVRSLIKRMGENKVIIFSTHILEEVEAACTRAIVIDRGKIVADGSPQDLKNRAPGAGSIRVEITGLSGSGIRQELTGLPHAAKVEEIEAGSDSFKGMVFPTKRASAGDLAAEIAKLCAGKNLSLRELHHLEGRLDDVFRLITSADTDIASKKPAAEAA